MHCMLATYATRHHHGGTNYYANMSHGPLPLGTPIAVMPLCSNVGLGRCSSTHIKSPDQQWWQQKLVDVTTTQSFPLSWVPNTGKGRKTKMANNDPEYKRPHTDQRGREAHRGKLMECLRDLIPSWLQQWLHSNRYPMAANTMEVWDGVGPMTPAQKQHGGGVEEGASSSYKRCRGEGDMWCTGSYCAHYAGNIPGQVSGTWGRVVGMNPYVCVCVLRPLVTISSLPFA